MERTTYKGYVIDHDNLGRLYVYNTASPYSEDSDRKLVPLSSYCESTDLKCAKHFVDDEIARSH
jgi:hypothetical protein